MVKRIIVFLFVSFSACISLFANVIQRLEPLNWWVGMKNPKVQLMLYGQKIADFEVKTDYLGVKIEQTTRTQNANYLFVNLHISPTAKAGTVRFDFLKNGKKVESRDWPLLARAQSREDIIGFDNSDVLYLITPDRFANGNAKNDAVAGLKEQPNRAFHGGRHGGDIQGIRNHLDYIKDMGFTAIWLNPVLENDMKEYSYHGYSTTDFYRVDPRYGSNEDYQKLAQEAKSKGIKMIMDMIVNHIGLEHWWMKDLPSDDWINQWTNYTETNHRKSLLQDPYASELDHKIFTDGWFVPTMPDLNQRNPLLATYLIQNGIWWIEYLGLAGIRMDTYPYPDMDYMTAWVDAVMAEYPNFNIVGEEWYENPAIVSYWQKGKKNPNGYTSNLPSLMDFPLQAALSKGLTRNETWGEGLVNLYIQLSEDFLYPDPNNLVVFPDNHDMSRIFTQLNEDYGLWKMAMAYTLTTRGIPQIYYGTEILMANPNSGEHGIIRSDFPGGWDGDAVNGFTGKGLSDEQKAAQDYLKKLLQWRQRTPTLFTGKLTHFVPKDGVYVYFRYDERETIMVVLNKNKEEVKLDMSRFHEILQHEIKTGTEVVSQKHYGFSGDGLMPVPPRDVLVLTFGKKQ